MSEFQQPNPVGGVGFSGLLTIVFITLKLTGYIHWSWIWVLSPLWITWILIVLIIAIYCIVTFWSTIWSWKK